MTTGYDKPLYILPFDHRIPYGEEVFGFREPMRPEQIAIVAASKQVIYEGLQAGDGRTACPRSGPASWSTRNSAPTSCATPIAAATRSPADRKKRAARIRFRLRRAVCRAYRSVSIRRSPKSWCITTRKEKSAANQQQTARLRQHLRLSAGSKKRLLHVRADRAPPEEAQLTKVGGDKQHTTSNCAWADGRRDDQCRTWASSPTSGRSKGSIVAKMPSVLAGHAATVASRWAASFLAAAKIEQKVSDWAAGHRPRTVPGYIGFAVGPIDVFRPLVGRQRKRCARRSGRSEMAGRFEDWIEVFRHCQGLSPKW